MERRPDEDTREHHRIGVRRDVSCLLLGGEVRSETLLGPQRVCLRPLHRAMQPGKLGVPDDAGENRNALLGSLKPCLDERDERRAHRRFPSLARQCIDKVAETRALLDDGENEVVFVREVVVDRPFGHSGRLRDLARRRTREAVFDEERSGGLDEPRTNRSRQLSGHSLSMPEGGERAGKYHQHAVSRIIAITIVALVLFWFVVVPLFERIAPRGTVRRYQRLAMPLFRASSGIVPGFSLIETTGRRTGKKRLTPVGGRVQGDVFWLVAGVGRDADYVRNIEADPRVRVKKLGRWRTGTAKICDKDNAMKRMFWVNPANGFFLLLAGGERQTIRVDLDGSP